MKGEKFMIFTVRFTCLLCLSSALSFAESWSGNLVDSKCYAAEERNVNPTDTQPYADRDRNLEIRYCSPSAKTKSFAVVQPDGSSLKFDTAGNAKAAGLVQKSGKKAQLYVAVTGELNKNTIQVESISTAR
jgi:hypothetical protein